MAEVDLGKVVPIVKGEWDEEESYERLDIVKDEDGVYIAKADVPVGTATSNASYWEKLVSNLTMGTVTTVSADTGASASISGTADEPVLDMSIPRGVAGNESIGDDKGVGDTDYVWSADKSETVVNSSRIKEDFTETYEIGSISLSNGSNNNSTTVAARTPGKMFFGRDVYKVTVTPKTGYYWSGRIYSKADGTYKNGVTSTGINKTGSWIESAKTFPNDPTMEYRFTLKKSDSSTIVIDDLPDDVLTFTVWRATDKGLTEAGVPADAEVTGAYINALNGENLMINTLRPGAETANRPLFNGVAPLLKENGNMTAVEHGLRLTASNNGTAQWIIFGKGFSAADLYGLEPGEWYTLSFDIKTRSTLAGRQNIYYHVGYDDGNNWENYLAKTVFDMDAGVTEGHVVYTFQVRTDIDKFRLALHTGTATAAGVVADYDYTEITNIMLQKGKVATNYRPNLKDMEEIAPVKWWESDADMRTKVQQLTKKTRIEGSQYGTAPFCMIHFSDIHGDGTRLKNVIAFKEYFGDYIQDILHTGDIVKNVSTDGLDFWNGVEGAENILNCIGNHDTRTSTAQTTEAWLGLSMAECYSMYYAPYVENWGVEIESGKTYYYKDYGENNVRLIVLDGMHERNNTEMLEWFAETLEGARQNGLHVIAASHIRSYWKLIPYDTTWDDYISHNYGSDTDQSETSLYPLNMKEGYLQAVEDFIDAGGNFVCWLHGHHHYRMFAYPEAYPRQLNVCVGSDNLGYENNHIWLKVSGTKSEDDFNVIGVDTYAKILRIAKAGVNYDRWMRKADTISYDYGNHRLIYSN